MVPLRRYPIRHDTLLKNLTGHSFVKGDLDELSLECSGFDALVSEWMGYGLFAGQSRRF